MQKKTDRRVRKTKSQLKTGLAQLMREKSIREITVKELVDAVDINRSTFYLHYSDIPGLLAEVENEMMESVNIQLIREKIPFTILFRIYFMCLMKIVRLQVRL